jgi:predicted N-acyltransferase
VQSSVASPYHVRFIDSITAVAASTWDALAGTNYPFMRHAFLAALEHTGCTTARTGWQPLHAIVESGDRIVGVMPLYAKTNSMGEYVFDWAWADAYQRHGLPYYPKLLTAIPFTPCAGPRLCSAADVDLTALVPVVQQAVLAKCEQLGASSWHVLFPQEDLRDLLVGEKQLLRTGCQYQWFNNDYADFDAYLATFASRKRKNLRKERSAVQEAGITLHTLEGAQVSVDQWEQFYEFYASTYFVRGRRPYLNTGFFLELGRRMPDQLMLVLATRADKAIAGALFFKGSDTLYGRYWGCAEDVPFLHFEACYYQGIDYCIRHGLKRMDSGAQGEHKIQRGFAPVPTWSTHWIARPDFRRAIGDYVKEEAAHIGDYMEQAADYLPFRKDLQL